MFRKHIMSIKSAIWASTCTLLGVLLASCQDVSTSQAEKTVSKAPAPSNISSVTAFINVDVLTMNEQGLLSDQTVTVSGDRIISIASAEKTNLPEGAEIIEGQGKYLMPGFGEMHGHIPPLSQGDKAVNDTLFLYLSNGVTTVRGMLGTPGQLQLREEAKSGVRLSPNLYLAGPSFNGNSVSSPQQATELVNSQVKEGWDLLKVHPGLTGPEYEAMASRAYVLGITFGGHVPEEVGLITALDSGQRTLDHLDGYISYLGGFDKVIPDADMRDIARKTKAAGVGVVPTSALWKTLIGAADINQLNSFDELKYMPKRTVENWQSRIGFLKQGNPEIHESNRQRLLTILAEEGVEILFGTDAPQLWSVPGFSIHHEIEAMQAAGLTPEQILVSGTSAVGAYFETFDAFGTVSPNGRADLILLNENPLENLDALKSPAGVMVRGQWISKGEIDQKLREIAVRTQE